MNRLQNRAGVGALCVIVSMGVAALAACNSSRGTEMTPEQQALLKTFLAEFIPITPGSGEFPADLNIKSEVGTGEQSKTVIKFPHSFLISKYETYQSVYEFVMSSNPSRWKGVRNSAESMTYHEAVEFCEKATELLRDAGLIQSSQLIRLPTEAEWEYCTRAGTDSKYSFGEEAQAPGDAGVKATTLDEYGWHNGNAAGNDPAVGVLKPNPWGLYDVHGYLWEYCQDEWSSNPELLKRDGHQPLKRENSRQVVIRGGSWKDAFPKLASASRRAFPKTGRDDAVGFRCVLTEATTE